LTLLLAALAAVALLVGWWAWQSPASVETTPMVPSVQVPGLVATPAGLGPRQPTVAEAMVRLDRSRTDDCLVEIVGHGNSLPGAVVAILDATTGAHLARTPLATQKLPCTVRFGNIPDGEHWAVLARNDSELRFAYLSRAKLRRHARAGGRRIAALRGQVHDLLVELTGTDSSAICHCVPVLLRRPDDPNWRHREPQGNPQDDDSAWLLLTDDAGKTRLHQLGAGRYLLSVDGFERSGSAPEWMPVTMDRDRSLRLKGSAH
jgi:hypothetical protein